MQERHQILSFYKLTYIILLIFMPFFTYIGTYLVNYYQNNYILMLNIFLISIIPIIISQSDDSLEKFYPVFIYCISLSLLYHRSLISLFLTGWDIHEEYHFYKLLEINGYLDLSIPRNTNSVIIYTLITVISSILTNLDAVFIFKYIFPLLFSLVPTGLYLIFSRQIKKDAAFLSVFYFISIFTFFTEMTQLIKQQIGEIFYMLIILTILNIYKKSNRQKFLYIIFGLGLILSHYGTTYLYLLISLISIMINILVYNSQNDSSQRNIFLLFILFSLSWYSYTSNSSIFITTTFMVDNIFEGLKSIFNPRSTQALLIITNPSSSVLHIITTILYLFSQFLIMIGISKSIYSWLIKKRPTYEKDFISLSIASFIIFLITIFVPRFYGMNVRRIFHILTFFLAPFFIIGGEEIFRILHNYFSIEYTHSKSLKKLSIFLTIFLLFNSGFIYEIVNQDLFSISLSQESMKSSGIDRQNRLYDAFFTNQDILGISWLAKNRSNHSFVYSDLSRKSILKSYGMMLDSIILNVDSKVLDESCIFLGYPNVRYGFMNGPRWSSNIWSIDNIYFLLNSKNKIYSNGGAITYY